MTLVYARVIARMFSDLAAGFPVTGDPNPVTSNPVFRVDPGLPINDAGDAHERALICPKIQFNRSSHGT